MRRPTTEILSKASAMKARGISKHDICVQKQWRYLTLATQAIERGKKASEAGKRREARTALAEATRYYKLFIAHGGCEDRPPKVT